jgi:hypothetical protein
VTLGDVPPSHAGEFPPSGDLPVMEVGNFEIFIEFGLEKDHGIIECFLALPSGECCLPCEA